MKINVINTETLKKFIKEEITNVISESRACDRHFPEGVPSKGEHQIIAASQYMSRIAHCVYGSARMWYKMQEFYFKNKDGEVNGIPVMPEAVERARRRGNIKNWPRMMRLGDTIYVPTDEELETMTIGGDSREDSVSAPKGKDVGLNALASVVDMIANHRDKGEMGLKVALMTPWNQGNTDHGQRWALAAKCASTNDGNDSDLKFPSAQAVHDELCKRNPGGKYCTEDCSALTGGEVETYIRRVKGDLRSRMHPE